MTKRRLSIFDTNFLLTESSKTPMHVAALMIFEIPKDQDQRFVSQVIERFRACQVFHNPWNYRLPRSGRLQFMPMLEEVHDVDLEYHVRHLALPQPGGEKQLGQMIARLHSQPLDFRKPLWEVYVIEGLENNRFAIYMKIHHALVDGVSGAKLLLRALSEDPNAQGQLPFWAAGGRSKREIPSAKRSQKRNFKLPNVRDLGVVAREAAGAWLRPGKEDEVSLRSAPRSIMNARVHSQRRFATHHQRLDRMKRIAKAAECSLNDVVLAASGAVLREYLLAHSALPERSLTASIPVSLHQPGDVDVQNKVGMIFTTLGTNIADDEQRMEAVKASVQAAKERLRKIPAGSQSLFSTVMLAPYVGTLTTGLAGRIKPQFNVVVSNVPGPSHDLYLYGARLAHLYPVSLPMHGGALNITCFSNAGNVNFGLTACRDSLPHMQQMAVSLGDAIDRLERVYCASGKQDAKSTTSKPSQSAPKRKAASARRKKPA